MAIPNNGTLTLVEGTAIDLSGGDYTFSANDSGSPTITIAVDLSELTTSTADGDGDYFAVIDTAGAQKKLTKANIALSGIRFSHNVCLNSFYTKFYLKLSIILSLSINDMM